MKTKLTDIFYREGYRFCKVKPEETGVFYKYYQEGFHIIMLIDLTGDYPLTAELHKNMQDKVMELFYHPQGRLADFPEGFPVYHVEVLTILFGGKSEVTRGIAQSQENIWLYEPANGQLIIYENQPGDFFGIRQKIEDLKEKPEWNTAANSAPDRTQWKPSRQNLKNIPAVTIAITAINVIVYFIILLLGDAESASFMAEHGAMYPEAIFVRNEWWRIITAMFLHFGATHLLNNMVIFCCVGSRLERVVGHVKMLLIYLLSGIGGGLLSYFAMLQTNSYAVSAGASGAVFGIIGGLLWAIIINKGNLEGITTRGMIFMIVLSIYFGIASVNVDNWSHLGGLLTGFFVTMILYHRKHQKY